MPTGLSSTSFLNSTEISINGLSINRYNSVYLNQPFDNHHTFEISLSPNMLPDRQATFRLNDLADKFAGEPITIKFKQGESVAGVISGKQEQTFQGIVTSVRMLKSQSGTSSLIISGSSPTILLCAGPTTRSFSEMTAKDVVQKITSSVGINSKISPTNEGNKGYRVQYEEDDYTFLKRLSAFGDEWVFYDGESFIYGKKGRSSVTPVILNLGSNLFDMEYDLRVTPLNSTWLTHNYLDNKHHEAKTTPPVTGLQTLPKVVEKKSVNLFKNAPTQLDQELHTSSSLQDVATKNKEKQANELAVLRGRTPEMEVKVGGLIKVKEDIYGVTDPKLGAIKTDTIDYGQFVITRLTHYVDGRGVYQATFEAIPEAADQAPVDFNMPPYILNPDLAVVKDVNDPKGLGRVKVQYYWQKADNQTTDWIKVVHPMSGKERGVYFLPELEEEVWVDYLVGRPNHPVVMSSNYHEEAKPGELFNKDNNIKGIITRSGNHIIINDESGKESIKIYNKDKKNSIELSLDGTHITLKSDGNINLQAAGDITMKAGGNFTMKAKNKAVVETTAGDIELMAGKDLNMSGLTNASLVAVEELNASGGTTKLTAYTKLDIDGGVMTTVKGGTVMINCP